MFVTNRSSSVFSCFALTWSPHVEPLSVFSAVVFVMYVFVTTSPVCAGDDATVKPQSWTNSSIILFSTKRLKWLRATWKTPAVKSHYISDRVLPGEQTSGAVTSMSVCVHDVADCGGKQRTERMAAEEASTTTRDGSIWTYLSGEWLPQWRYGNTAATRGNVIERNEMLVFCFLRKAVATVVNRNDERLNDVLVNNSHLNYWLLRLLQNAMSSNVIM